jgi:hypothetical protein
MADVGIDEENHGPGGDRSLDYGPTFILRGLTETNIKYSPAALSGSSVRRPIGCECSRTR